ncbi:MAG: two pore domain potassium channel family protein [Planctomycetota bacterium]|nr:MAG: two pore domain potassium channel family protein [Planctomycetota bacterium]
MLVENLILGCTAMAVCLSIQCVVVTLLVKVLVKLRRKRQLKPSIFAASSVLIVSMLAMVVGNFVQMSIWAWLFVACGQFEEFRVAFYHSVVNFSTLGYGDIVMSEDRRLLGGLEAVNGVMMFGLTTGVLFTVLSVTVQRALEERLGRDEELLHQLEKAQRPGRRK